MADFTIPPELMMEAAQATELFHAPNYLRHNARRLEHLATLGLPIAGTTVLEVGAGIGDHTSFYLDRGCTVTSVEAREANCHVIALQMARMNDYEAERARLAIVVGDAQFLAAAVDGQFDVIHCYGLLYHLADPEPTLAVMAGLCTRFMVLETCVSPGRDDALNPVAEAGHDPTQAFHGMGCRPTRSWIFARLKRLFPHVYVPKTQPAHAQFPTDWAAIPADVPKDGPRSFFRAVFVASRAPLETGTLVDHLVDQQPHV